MNIDSNSCTTFTTDVQNVRRLQRHKHKRLGRVPFFIPLSRMRHQLTTHERR